MLLWTWNIIVFLLRFYLSLFGKKNPYKQTYCTGLHTVCFQVWQTRKKYRVSCNYFWLQKLKLFFPTAATVSFSLKRIPKQSLIGILLCLPSHLGLHLKKWRMKKLPEFVLIWRNECSKNVYIEQNMWLQPYLLCYRTSVLFAIFVLIWNEFYFRVSL